VLSLGADEHIDYAAQRFEDVVKDADIVLDGMPTPDHVYRSLDAVKPYGTLVSIVVLLDHNLKLAQKARTSKVFMHRLGVETATGEDIQTVAGLLASGAIRSHVSTTFAFPDLAGAHKAVETGHTRGKVVVTF
jgi:NADPH:quinone reductase-like Zn-dependent oxidoreductase